MADAPARYGRGIVKRAKGDAEADMAAAKASDANIAETYASYSVK
jgi:hypothetical protein